MSVSSVLAHQSVSSVFTHACFYPVYWLMSQCPVYSNTLFLSSNVLTNQSMSSILTLACFSPSVFVDQCPVYLPMLGYSSVYSLISQCPVCSHLLVSPPVYWYSLMGELADQSVSSVLKYSLFCPVYSLISQCPVYSYIFTFLPSVLADQSMSSVFTLACFSPSVLVLTDQCTY